MPRVAIRSGRRSCWASIAILYARRSANWISRSSAACDENREVRYRAVSACCCRARSSMTIIGSTKKLDILGRLGDLAHRPIVTRVRAIALFVASVLSGFDTYLALTGEFGDDISQTTVLLLLILNLVLLLLLGAVVSWQFIALWLERRRGLLGARLHLRLVLWFSLIAMVPTIII